MNDPTKLARLDSPERRRRTPPEAIVSACAPQPAMRVADVGAGAGFWTLALLASASPPAHIDAIEPAADLREALVARIPGAHAARVTTHEGRAEALPLADGTVDLVTLGNVLHELAAAEPALAEAHRVLAAGGRVVVVEWPPPRGASAEDVRAALLAAGFVELEALDGFPGLVALRATRA